MTWWLLKYCSDRYEMIIVFANTGKEREETLLFIERCSSFFGWDTIWIEAVVNPVFKKGIRARQVDFNSASRNGEPFEAMISKAGIPNIGAPRCSRDLKAYPIRAYAKSIGWKDYHTAIGIRADEPGRLNWDRAKKEKLLFPLASLCRTTKADINLFWLEQPFDLQLASYEGNCDLCWKKSLRKLMTIAAEHPELTAWWKTMEEKYGDRMSEGVRRARLVKTPTRFYREHLSITDIIELAAQPFEKATDDHRTVQSTQLALFDTELDDQTQKCAESCEAF